METKQPNRPGIASSFGIARSAPSSLEASAVGWTQLSAGERKRRATELAASLDCSGLSGLSEAYSALYGARGALVSANTLSAYRLAVRSLCAFCLGQGWNLVRPARDMAAAWKLTMEAGALSAATVRQRLAGARTLGASLRWAGVTQTDFFPSHVKPGKDLTSRAEKARSYSAADIRALLDTANPRDCVAVALLAHGLRLSELLALKWSDIDHKRNRLRVTGKGRKIRTVFLDSSACAFLLALEQTGERVIFPPITPQGFRKRLARLCKAAGVRYLGAHAFRHYCGEHLYRASGDLGLVADHLGHASLDTARIYAKQSAELENTIRAGVLPGLNSDKLRDH